MAGHLFPNKMKIRLSLIVIFALLIVNISPCNSIVTQSEENEDISSVWDGSSTAPMEKDEKGYVITSAEQFAGFANSVNDGHKYENTYIRLAANIYLDDNEWTSIGYNMNNYFAGTFDGNGHFIIGLNTKISIDSANIVNAPKHTTGLFGVCRGAKINNLNIVNASLSVRNESGYSSTATSIANSNVYAGGACAWAEATTFSGVRVIASSIDAYTGAEAQSSFAGGLCGYAKDNCTFSYCVSSENTITGKSVSLSADCYAGGLVGRFDNEGLIYESFNTSTVIGGHNIAAAYTGGIVGMSKSSSSALSSIRDSYNRGNVSHEGSWMETGALGGIIGYSESSVVRCYNSGNVVANTNTYGGDFKAAGIAGDGKTFSVVLSCAVLSGKISGGTSNKIIAGNGTKTSNIALNSISGSPDNDSNKRYTAAELLKKETYEDISWNFDDIWSEHETEYPTFAVKKEHTAEEIVNDAVNKLFISMADGDNYDSITQNIGLTSSSNEDVISSSDGSVKRKNEDCMVHLTATVSYEGYSVDKVFTLNVLGINSNAEIVPMDWGMSLNEARSFMSIVRDKRFTEVSADEQAVQVLIGMDTDEEHIAEVMAEIMQFWEVPGESAYLKSKMGDVMGLIKEGQDSVMSELISEFSGGYAKWDSANQSAGLNSEKIAKKCIAICESSREVQESVSQNIKKFIAPAQAIKNYSFKSDQDVINSSFEFAEKWGSLLDYLISVQKSTGINAKAGERIAIAGVIATVKNVLTAYQLWDAYEIEKQNSIREYQIKYLQNRKLFSSVDDEYFKILMAANKVTYWGGDVENLDNICEQLYKMQTKFCKGVGDEYKIIIQCPVDVYVYDEKGMLVGAVANNIIDSTIYNSIKIELAGKDKDEKILYFDDSKKYSIKLIGTDTGSMDITISSGKEGKFEDCKFEDIPLNIDKEMVLDTDFTKFDEHNYPVIDIIGNGVYTGEKEYTDKSNILYPVSIFTCIENSDGTVSATTKAAEVLNGYYVIGTDINSLINISEGYAIQGLYSDVACTDRIENSYTVDNEMVIYAKFKKIGTQSTKIPALPTDEPVSPTNVPALPTVSALPTGEPIQSGEPALPTGEPAKPTDTPIIPTSVPVQPTNVPEQSTHVPTETKKPSDDVTANTTLPPLAGYMPNITDDNTATSVPLVSGLPSVSPSVTSDTTDSNNNISTTSPVNTEKTDSSISMMVSPVPDKNSDSSAEVSFEEDNKSQENSNNPNKEDNVSEKINTSDDITKSNSKIKIKVGMTITHQKTSAVYKILSSGEGKYTAKFVKPLNKNIKGIKIRSSIRIRGKKYKIVSISSKAFKGCRNLKDVTIGKNIKKIGNQAFANCKSLKRITIPKKVKKLGKKSFFKCGKLQYITIKTKKLTYKSVGQKIFVGIHKNAIIHTYKSKWKLYESIFNKKGIENGVVYNIQPEYLK